MMEEEDHNRITTTGGVLMWLSSSSSALHRWLEDATTTTEDDSNKKTALRTFASVMSSVLLFLLIFGLSATVDMKNLRKQLNNKFALLTGLCMQFLIMPALGFLAVVVLRNYGLTPAMGLTLLVVTASPGGSYSNWWCSTFNADLALSVAMTAISTILSVGLLPANLFLYTHLAYGTSDQNDDMMMEGDVIDAVDFGALFISLGIVIAAILSGLFASYKMDSPSFQKWANKGGTVAGVLLIVFSAVIGSGTGDSESSFWSHDWTFYVGVAFPCLVGLALANLICRCFRLAKPEVVAISVECCYQNVGIATSVAITMFDDPTQRAEAVSVPLFYGIVEAVVLGLYCIVSWKVGWTKAPKDEKLCVVVSTTYEVAEDEQDLDEEAPIEPFPLEEDEEQQKSQEDEALHQHKGWFRWLASPFRRRKQLEAEAKALDEPEKPKGGERSRIVSEDYTASTADTSGSSGTSSVQHNSSGSGDVEVSLESILEVPSFVKEVLSEDQDDQDDDCSLPELPQDINDECSLQEEPLASDDVPVEEPVSTATTNVPI